MSETQRDRLAIEGGRPVRGEMLAYGVPEISEDDIREVVDTLRSGWIGSGPKVERFEGAFREYQGCGEAVAVSSCTSGIFLALVASGIGEGHEVITSAMTFAATANTILATGATPVVVDCDPDHLCLTPSTVEKALTERTRAVLPVHFAGRPADLSGFETLCQEHDLVLVSDAAHAIESRHRGRSMGSYGKAAVYSFYANKNLTTGEGGMVTTDDSELAERIRCARTQGLASDAWNRRGASSPMVVRAPSLKHTMTDIQASLGIHQLARLEDGWRRRASLVELYREQLDGLPIQFSGPAEPEDRHAWHLFVFLLQLDRLSVDRDTVARALRAENIGSGIHYLGLHRHPAYGLKAENYPIADRISDQTLTLPLSPGMSDGDAMDVTMAVRKVLERYRI